MRGGTNRIATVEETGSEGKQITIKLMHQNIQRNYALSKQEVIPNGEI